MASSSSGFKCGSSELCTMFASEWRADSQALASDGQYWRSVYGGARLVLGCIRVTPGTFACMRLLCTVGAGLIFFFEAERKPLNSYSFLYFHIWVFLLQMLYFVLATVLTVVAVCTAGGGGIARTTPFYVRITELCYGAVLPAALINALMLLCVNFLNQVHCVTAADESDQRELAILAGLSLLLLLLDTAFTRQPYYASFHAVVGLLFAWAWLLFSALYEVLGGRDEYGHSYIYRCLDWSYPIAGGRSNAEGKLMILNFFIVLPLANYLYWVLVWARRRTLTLYKKPEPGLGAPLTQTPRPPTGRRILFEYVPDFRDLALDGRHWRAQFGGSSSPKAPKMGAYICCDAATYPVFRLVVAVLTVGLFAVRLLAFESSFGEWWALMLYFENWTQLLSAIYFSTACVLTAFAACTDGAESNGTPIVVWFCWACYGALLPAAVLSGLCYLLVTTPWTTRFSLTGTVDSSTGTVEGHVLDVVSIYGTLLLVLLDAWINRQPYYATFHSFCGVLFAWSYFVFNIAWVMTGGTNEAGMPYIYRQLNWSAKTFARWMTPGKITITELFIFIPMLNCLYWCMLWARRRARVAAKQSAV